MISLFKQAGEKNYNNKTYQFWIQNNHPIELESNSWIDQKVNYIHNNPVEQGIVDYPEEYLYSSARDYAGADGLLKVELLD